MLRNWTAHTLPVGIEYGVAIKENNYKKTMQLSYYQGITNRDIYPEEMKIYAHTKTSGYPQQLYC